MKYKTQDPKFWIETSADHDEPFDPRLVGQSGPVQPDEPIFIFRARDRFALDALLHYRHHFANAGSTTAVEVGIESDKRVTHLAAIDRRIADFSAFAALHSERMKTPDTNLEQLHDGKPA